MVILAVLAMLIIITVLSAQLGDNSVALDHRQRVIHSREDHYQMARSAVELAMDLLMVDTNDYDGAGDLWAFGSQRLTWEGKPLFLEIRDEEGRFPLIKLMRGGKDSEELRPYEEALGRLLQRNGLSDKEAVASLEDWCDADSDVRQGGGEAGVYNDIRVKNAPLDSLDELRYVSRWGPPTLPPPPALNPGGLFAEEAEKYNVPLEGRGANMLDTVTGQQRQDDWVKLKGASEWSDWLTLYSGGKVNLNTAPEEVLRSLDAYMTDTVVNELVSSRQKKALKKEDDLKQIAGVDSDLAFRLAKIAGFKSDHFRVRVVVDVRPGRLQLDAFVKREKKGAPKVLYWKVN